MSLASAVLEIVEQMTEECKQQTPEVSLLLQAYIRQMRTAVKAAEGQPQPSYFHQTKEREILARTQERKARQQAEQAEFDNQSLMTVRLVGGTFDGDNVPCPSDTPLGHTMRVGGQKYVLQNDGKYHWEEEK